MFTVPEANFFSFWTKKESLLKTWGLGLSVPLANVKVGTGTAQIIDTTCRGHFHEIVIPGYVCHVCTSVEGQEVSIAFEPGL